MKFSLPLFIFIVSSCLFLPVKIGAFRYDDGFIANDPDDYGTPIWNHTYGGPLNDVARDVISLQDGGYALTGIANNPGLTPVGDCFLLKTDSEGNQLWNQTYSATIQGKSIIEISTGGFAILGDNSWLLRLDEFGNLMWNRTYQDEFNALDASKIIENKFGGFALVGYQYHQNESGIFGQDFSFLLTDSNGNLLFRRLYSGPADNPDYQIWGDDYAYDIIEHNTGGYVIAGALDRNLALMRIDEIGNLIWSETYQHYGYGEGLSLIETSDGGIIVAGIEDGEIHLIRTDNSGNLTWDITYGAATSALKVLQMNDGSLAICATKDNAVWFARIAHNGTLLWDRSYTYHDNQAYARSFVFNGNKEFIVVGTTFTDLLQLQIWIISIAEDSESTESLEIWILSVTAVGVVMVVLVLFELFRRRRQK